LELDLQTGMVLALESPGQEICWDDELGLATRETVAVKKYTLEVVIHEGNDEFWESLGYKTGCDEILDSTKNLLEAGGALHCNTKDGNCEIKLVEYTDK
jgi:hypothetical protein